jgi:peroxiredoxin (alkyl hydroperoxide reductase subunit C)
MDEDKVWWAYLRRSMEPSVGTQVPDLTAEAYVPGARGPQTIAVPADGDAWTALVFYPGDFTCVCPIELQGFAELQDEFAAEGATLLAASSDSYYAHKAWFESNSMLANVRYPVLADPTKQLSRAFGTERGTFLIDPEGIVRHTSTDLSPAETLRTLRALRDWQPAVATLSVAA